MATKTKAPQPPSGPISGAAPRSGTSLSAVLQLMTDPATASSFDRQAQQLTAAIQQCKTGFTAQIASDGVPQVLSCLCNTMKEQHADATCLEEPFVVLLQLCGLPITCTTLNDQRLHVDALEAVMIGVGSALDLPQERLRVTAASVLRQLFSSVRVQCFDDLNRNPNVTFHKKKDLQRSISENVVAALLRAWGRSVEKEVRHVMESASTHIAPRAEGSESDDDAAASNAKTAKSYEMVTICKAILELTHYRRLCTLLLSGRVCDLIFSTLQLCSAGDQRVPLSVEMLWNLLELCPSAAAEVGTRQHLEVLHTVLLDTLSLGFKLQERELRNDVIVVMGLVSSDPVTHANFSIDLIELLFCLACGNELGKQHASINPTHHGTTHAEELQLKLVTWDVLAQLCTDAAIAERVFEWGFFDVLLAYVNVNSQIPAVVAWSTLQVLDIQMHVLRLLHFLMPKGSEWFSQCSGPATVFSYIEECQKESLRNQAVGVLAAAASTDIRGGLVSVGCIPLAIRLLNQSVDLNLRIDCLNLLADVVQRDPALQRQFDEHDGITAVLPLLSLVPEEYTDLLESVIFAAVDCVWQCVFGNDRSVTHFVALGGIPALLSVLETSPPWMIPLPLSCLADLLQFEAAANQCRMWRSPRTGLSGVQIALSLWRMEPLDNQPAAEAVATNESTGLLAVGSQMHRPLPFLSSSNNDDGNGFTDEAILTQALRKDIKNPPEDIRHIVESQNTNFKVFSMLAVLGFEGHNELDADERATLAAVSQFVALCKDEVWENIEESLAAEGVVPIAADAEVLNKVRKEAENRSTKLHATRRAYQEIHSKRKEESERTFYQSLIKKTEERTVSSTKPLGLSITEAKIRKAQMLKASFKQAVGKSSAPANNSTEASAEPESTTEVTVTREAAPTSVEPQTPQRWDPGQRTMREDEYEILQALNEVRTHPTSLIPVIEEKLKYLDESGSTFYVPGCDPETCVEGASAYLEAIDFLNHVRPLVTLLDVPVGLVYAARDHVADLAGRMDVSQEGSDKSNPISRLKRYGTPGRAAQLTALGQRSAAGIVMQLVVDDGVSSRIDRSSIFDPDARLCGLSVGPHSIHDTVAVIILAHEFVELPAKQQKETHQTVLTAHASRK